MLKGTRILVAPLDWGLGHAARCVPIIRELIRRQASPVIAADRGALALLRHEFPTTEHVRLPGHEVRYSTGNDQTLPLVRQFPQMLRSIGDEKRATQNIISDLRIDAIISDQRFGVRSGLVPSVLITHQLFPRTPFFQTALQRLNHGYIRKFDLCWVMDHADAPGLAGALSHGESKPDNVRYIGPRSRFSGARPDPDGKYRIVAILSGPEPQRSILEATILKQMHGIPGEHLLVQGLMEGAGPVRSGNISIVPALAALELEAAMSSAALVVSRCGYTTLMDLRRTGTRALLIPTPGQYEQEYLGMLHASDAQFTVHSQNNMDLVEALGEQQSLQPQGTQPDTTVLDIALLEFARSIFDRCPLPSAL